MSHGPADLARAVFESVAWDVQRCLEAMAAPSAVSAPRWVPAPRYPVWLEVLSGITGLPTDRSPVGAGGVGRRRAAGGGGGGHAVDARTGSTPSPGGSRSTPPWPPSTGGCGRRRTGWPTRSSSSSGPARVALGAAVRVSLAYGRTGLDVDVPDDAVVVEPREQVALVDEWGAVRSALVVPDRPAHRFRTWSDPVPRWWWPSPTSPGPCPTPPCCRRCWPNWRRRGPVPTGWSWCAPPGPTGRPATTRSPPSSEPTSSAATGCASTGPTTGTTSGWGRWTGRPVLLDRGYVEADVRIVTGFVEPHFFAGWSGGPQGGVPGAGGHLDRPRGPQPGPHRRPARHLDGDRGEPGPRVRPGRHRAVPAPPVGGRDHRPGAPPDRRCSPAGCPRPTGPPAHPPPGR